MGCWNATCNVSNLPIFAGDRIALIPVVKVREKGVYNNCYATDNFVPFAFPIFGEYDEYGGIENIKTLPINENIIRSYSYWYVRDKRYDDKTDEFISIADKTFEQLVNDVLCCCEGVCIKTDNSLFTNGMAEINFLMVHRDLYDLLVEETGKRMPYGSKGNLKQCLTGSFAESFKRCESEVVQFQKLMDEMPDEKSDFFKLMQERNIMNCAEKIFGYGENLNPCRSGWCLVIKNLLETKDTTILMEVVNKALFTQALSFLRKGYLGDSGCGSQSQETRMHYILANYIIEKIRDHAVQWNADAEDDEDKISECGVEETIFYS